MTRLVCALVGALVLLGPGCAQVAGHGPAPPAAGVASAERAQAFSTRPWRPVAADALFDAIAGSDLVFVGERHDDAGGHAFELRLLQAMAQRNRPVTLALEMFERDAQPLLDGYLAGRIDEPTLLAGARPWPNYARDYRPLVEFARAHGWPVVAANAPRSLAARVAREGLGALAQLGPAERRQVAAELICPRDAYRARFEAAIGDLHPAAAAGGHGAADGTAMQRLYESQCVKDETMAEAAVAALESGRTVIHVNGQFHSDGRGGVVQRAARRRPDAKVLVLSLQPASERGHGASAKLADYVVLAPWVGLNPSSQLSAGAPR